MCDYSLQAFKSRPATVEDKLVIKDFGRGTSGFADVSDPDTVVCILPGTELAFDAPIETVKNYFDNVDPQTFDNVAVFTQINKEYRLRHHDALEFADGRSTLLTSVKPGQTAKVIQLPAEPKTEAEAKAQERVKVEEHVFTVQPANEVSESYTSEAVVW